MFKSWKPRRWKVVTVNKSLWQASVGPKSWKYWICLSFPCILIWVNYNISLTWIKAIWGWFPLLTMIPVRSQWGRYNLPRFIVDFPIYTSIYRLRGGFPASHVWFFRGFFHFNDHQWKTNSRHCHLRPSRGWLDSNCNAPVCLPRICQFVKWWMFAKHIFKRWDTKRH